MHVKKATKPSIVLCSIFLILAFQIPIVQAHGHLENNNQNTAQNSHQGSQTVKEVQKAQKIPKVHSATNNSSNGSQASSQTLNAVSQNSGNVSKPDINKASGASHNTTVKSINFKKTKHGGGKINVNMSQSNGRINISSQKSKLTVTFYKARLKSTVEDNLNLSKFSTPIKKAHVENNNGNVVLTIIPKNHKRYSRISYENKNRFTIQLLPKKQKNHVSTNSNKNMNLSFQNIQVKRIFQIIANVANINIVVSNNVKGTMALSLKNVPWRQVMNVILKAKGLGTTKHGNVITVAPLSQIISRRKAEQKAKNANKNLKPLESTIIQINYANAAKIASLLKSQNSSFLSPRGQISVDKRTNSLLINDTKSRIHEIKKLINKLDVPTKQVLVESRIVVANKSFSQELGVKFSGKGHSGKVKSNFSSSLAASGPIGQFATSIISKNFDLNLALSALQSTNKGEVVSQPRVVTSDNQEAKISQGTEIPYLRAARSGAATVSFKKANLSLQVKPKITPNNKISMKLLIHQDTVGKQIHVQGGGTVPSIDTRTVSTQVLINDGSTVVLGGIYTSKHKNGHKSVPYLSSIPVLGNLFKNRNNSKKTQEILIFISPTVINQKGVAKNVSQKSNKNNRSSNLNTSNNSNISNNSNTRNMKQQYNNDNHHNNNNHNYHKNNYLSN